MLMPAMVLMPGGRQAHRVRYGKPAHPHARRTACDGLILSILHHFRYLRLTRHRRPTQDSGQHTASRLSENRGCHLILPGRGGWPGCHLVMAGRVRFPGCRGWPGATFITGAGGGAAVADAASATCVASSNTSWKLLGGGASCCAGGAGAGAGVRVAAAAGGEPAAGTLASCCRSASTSSLSAAFSASRAWTWPFHAEAILRTRMQRMRRCLDGAGGRGGVFFVTVRRGTLVRPAVPDGGGKQSHSDAR